MRSPLVFLFVGVNHSLYSPKDVLLCILVYDSLALWMVSLLLVLETSVRDRKPVELEGEVRRADQNSCQLLLGHV